RDDLDEAASPASLIVGRQRAAIDRRVAEVDGRARAVGRNRAAVVIDRDTIEIDDAAAQRLDRGRIAHAAVAESDVAAVDGFDRAGIRETRAVTGAGYVDVDVERPAIGHHGSGVVDADAVIVAADVDVDVKR